MQCIHYTITKVTIMNSFHLLKPVYRSDGIREENTDVIEVD